MFNTPSNLDKQRPNKSYLLHFYHTKDLFGKKNLNIVLKSFKLDARGQERKVAFIQKVRKKEQSYVEISINKEMQKKLTGGLSIKEKDINIILGILYDTLATNKGFDEVKNIILRTDKKIKYNPIIIAMLDSGTRVEDILKMVDFPFKMEIMEVLTNDTITNREKFNKIKKLLGFKKIQDTMASQMRKQVIEFVVYMAIIATIVVGLKLKLIPTIKEKLVAGIGLDEKIMLGEAYTIVDGFTYFGIGLGAIVLFFLLLFIFHRQMFYKIIYSIPLTKNIIQSINTLRLLMIFGFSFNKITEFRKKIFDVINMYFKLSENTTLQRVDDITNYTDENLEKKWGITFFDPLVALGLDQLKEGGPSVVDEMVDLKLDVYVERMESAQKKLSTIVGLVLKIIIMAAVGVLATVILGVSFNAQKAFNANSDSGGSSMSSGMSG